MIRITFVVFILLLPVVALLFFYTDAPLQPASDMPFVATGSVATSAGQSHNTRIVPEGMREYRTATYRFSLMYPSELTVEERSEGGGASTVTFQNVERGEGFQIFIVPYEGTQVSEERFKQDIPSGVRESLTNIAVDGAPAAAFYSKDALLGETREVWLVHGGFLYEVTTLKSLDAWLDGIMRTWEFFAEII